MISFTKKLAVGSILGVLWLTPAFARSPVLEWADLKVIINNVQWNPQNQGLKPVTPGTRIQPQGVLQTGRKSRADLLFNEGTLARTASNTNFEFRRGLNELDLRRGRILTIITPGSAAGKELEKQDSEKKVETTVTTVSIRTSEAQVRATGTTFFAEHNPESKTTRIGVLANSPDGPVTVRGSRGGTAKLRAGTVVSVVDGVVGAVEDFDLQWFYRTSQLAIGLGPGEEKRVAQEPPAVQKTLNAARAKTLAAMEEQMERLEIQPQEEISPLDLPDPSVPRC